MADSVTTLCTDSVAEQQAQIIPFHHRTGSWYDLFVLVWFSLNMGLSVAEKYPHFGLICPKSIVHVFCPTLQT